MRIEYNNKQIKPQTIIIITLAVVSIIFGGYLLANNGESGSTVTDKNTSNNSNSNTGQGQTNSDDVNEQKISYALVNGVPSKETTAGLPVPEYFDKLESPNVVFDLVVEEGKLMSGPSTIEVKKDQSVKVNILVQHEEARVRLEGYEIITESDVPSPGGFSFIANKTGTFNFYALPEDEHEDAVTKEPSWLGKIIVK